MKQVNSLGRAGVEMPVGISGRIHADGKVDRYRFHAREGDRLEFEVRAREFGSALPDSTRERRRTSAKPHSAETISMPVEGSGTALSKS